MDRQPRDHTIKLGVPERQVFGVAGSEATLLKLALAQRALAFSSICSVASKATTELACGASAAVTTPGPQAMSSNLPRRASPSAAPRRPGSSAFAAQRSKFSA